MRWRKPANRAFVQAAITAFHEEPEQGFAQLSKLPVKAWTTSDYWLETSGLALYFYDLLCRRSMLDLVPDTTRAQLRSNLHKNRRRTKALFREFVALNESFSEREISYANYKGFTLCPHASPHPELRHQLDLDFLVASADLPAARRCLEERGYSLSAATPKTWEFKAGNDLGRKRWDNYTMGTYRSVELHFGIYRTAHDRLTIDERLLRLSTWTWQGKAFPSLSAQDQLIGQALHLFSHFRNESTRLSWLLEFRRHVCSRHDDAGFWRQIISLAGTNRDAPIAFGLSILITSKVFGRFAPPAVETWALESVPTTIRSWADRYGVEAVLADFPGTKLYLLLEAQLELLEGRPPLAMRTRLFPIRRMGSCFSRATAESVPDKLRCHVRTVKFALFRLRFHATQALRIAIELPQWTRLLRKCAGYHSHVTAAREMTNRKQVDDKFSAPPR